MGIKNFLDVSIVVCLTADFNTVLKAVKEVGLEVKSTDSKKFNITGVIEAKNLGRLGKVKGVKQVEGKNNNPQFFTQPLSNA